MKSIGESSSRTSMVAMNTSGTTRLIADSVISETPGFIIGLSCLTSLAARAMRSPTRCLLWKVWLLPSRLWYSSSRASRSSRWPRASTEKLWAMSMIERTTTTIRIVSPIRRRAALPSPPRTASKALPVRRGTSENSTFPARAQTMNEPSSGQ